MTRDVWRCFFWPYKPSEGATCDKSRVAWCAGCSLSSFAQTVHGRLDARQSSLSGNGGKSHTLRRYVL